MDLNLSEIAIYMLYGRFAYINEIPKELHEKFNRMAQNPQKENSIERNTWAEELENRYYRKTIENNFADHTAKFPKKYMP